LARWLLSEALRLRDPYKIARAVRLVGEGLYRGRGGGPIFFTLLEASLWVRDVDAGNAVEEAMSRRAVEVPPRAAEYFAALRSWRENGELPESTESLDAPSWSRLPWIFETMRAAWFEQRGAMDEAQGRYRNALKGIPNWLPEARAIYDKLNIWRRGSGFPGVLI
jgi:hypothetical protein